MTAFSVGSIDNPTTLTNFVDELRIVGQIERVDLMSLEPEGFPDPPDGRFGQSGLGGHRGPRPKMRTNADAPARDIPSIAAIYPVRISRRRLTLSERWSSTRGDRSSANPIIAVQRTSLHE
jgi:hypothetical protein